MRGNPEFFSRGQCTTALDEIRLRGPKEVLDGRNCGHGAREGRDLGPAKQRRVAFDDSQASRPRPGDNSALPVVDRWRAATASSKVAARADGGGTRGDFSRPGGPAQLPRDCQTNWE